MDKYYLLRDYLINYFKGNDKDITLSFDEINKINKIPLDHSFLHIKKT